MDYVIYHQTKPGTDCLDGIVAATIAMAGLKWEANLFPDVYRSKEEYGDFPEPEKYPFKAGDRLWVVDFSHPRRWLEHWYLRKVQVNILEHHADKFPGLKGFWGGKVLLDEKECGATLAWQHFCPGVTMPRLLEEVRRRDIGLDGYYLGESRKSEEINEGLSLWRHKTEREQGKEEMMRLLWARLSSNRLAFVRELKEIGKKSLVQRDLLVEEAAARAIATELQGYRLMFVRLEGSENRHYSVIGSVIARQRENECDMVWIQTDSGHSLRSIKGNCLPLAQQFGGGGHPNAAGFYPPEELIPGFE